MWLQNWMPIRRRILAHGHCQDAHLNGTWMDPEAPFPSIPATLDVQWVPVLERMQ